MKSNYRPLGDYIKLVDERNVDGKIERLLGINITKNFMPSVANVSETDLTKYKVITKGQFACNIMHVGRDERLPIALYDENEDAIVSPAYKVFIVKNIREMLPEYLMVIFQRSEFDRFTWFVCDSSIRGGLEWDRFCEIEIPVPDIEEQKKYVAMYRGLINNQQCYEQSLDDLTLICDSFLEALVTSNKPKRLGSYIRQCDEKNGNLAVDNLLGISVEKKFIVSKANKNGLSLTGYKIVKPKQFSYVTVTSRNGDKISIAILEGEKGIVSSTYIVFEVIDEKVLMPEFLFLWFKRPEFDRYARFHSFGSARETFDWKEMCNVRLPIPDIEIQKSIVAMHHALETRKRINEDLKDTIKPLCPILVKGVENILVTSSGVK
jgi:type I restriction enzyme, S subunit